MPLLVHFGDVKVTIYRYKHQDFGARQNRQTLSFRDTLKLWDWYKNRHVYDDFVFRNIIFIYSE